MGQAIDAYELDSFQALQAIARLAPLTHRKQLRKVLTSFGDYSPADLRELWDGDWLPQQWIQTWQSSLSGNTEATGREQAQPQDPSTVAPSS